MLPGRGCELDLEKEGFADAGEEEGTVSVQKTNASRHS